jgi:hypothetical protein
VINTVKLGDLTVANANVIISRIQNRRGLKQDLPQPLRPGEIGFALDTRQVFIGADPDDATSGGYNKVSVFETTTNAKDITISIANNQIIAFTVPFKKYPRSSFDGITATATWNPTSNTYVGSGTPVFSENITAGVSNATGITSIVTNSAFTATDILVLKNGTLLVGDSGNSTPAASKDYSFAASRDSANTHVLTFRSAPLATDEIGICYYSNAAVIDALSNTTVIYPGTSIQSFYTTYNIPDYRKIPDELVTVSTTSGHGLIGLEYKHIAVTADGTNNMSSTTGLTLGNLLLSRSDSAVSTNTTVGNTTITFSVEAGHDYNVAGPFAYVYVTNPDNANVYLNDKLFQLTANTANTISIAIPSNAATTSRSVTAAIQTGSTSNIVLTGNAEGVVASTNVYIVGSANSNIAGNTFTVVSANTTAFVVNISNVSLFNAGIDSNISFVGYNASNEVVAYSKSHGELANLAVDVSSSSNTTQLSNITYTVGATTANTFVLTGTSASVKNVTFNISPDLANVYTTNYITPVRSINLSSSTTISAATAEVNEVEDWPSMNLLPGSSSRVYLTHRNAYSSVGINFRIHEDPVTPTASVFKLAQGEYTTATTVKAKLETWMNSILESDDVNLFSKVFVGAKYALPGDVASIDDYILDIDNTFDEITFDSREEARDFNKTVNNLYFEKTSSDIKGLVNLKTNIELQTRTAAVVGDKTVSYTEMNTATIPAGGGNINSMTQSISVYNTYLIDYTITEASSVTGVGENYQRVGTMFISGRSDFNSGNGDVLFRDVSSEMVDTGLTGNVVFSASLVSDNIVLNAVNNVNRDLSIKYLIKRWSSDPS